MLSKPTTAGETRMNRILTTALGLTSLASVGLLAGWSNGLGSYNQRETVFETRAAERLYEVDNVHSSLIFSIRHAGMANFYGRFNDFTGEIHFDQTDPAKSRMAFTVQTDSVDTANKSRDGHLRDADFFNSRQYPTISFESTGMRANADGSYELTGNLTMMGETNPVTATVTGLKTGKVRDNDALGFEARFSIKRSDFGMNKYLAPDQGEDGGLGNTVNLIVAVEAVAK